MSITSNILGRMKTTSPFAKRLFGGVILLNVLIYFLIVLFSYFSWREYESAISITTQNYAQVLEKNISAMFGKADIAILSIKDEVEKQLVLGKNDGKELENLITRQASRVTELHSLLVSNELGIITHGIAVSSDTPINIADREYFIYVRNNPITGIYLTKPVISRVTNKWVVNIVRRFNSPDGSFGGVIIGSFTIEYLTRMFSEISLGTQGTIALRDTELTTIARFPEPMGIGSTIGQKSSMKELLDEVQLGKTTATFIGKASVDNIMRCYTFRKLSGMPLFILVGYATSDYRIKWIKETVAVDIMLIFFSLMTVFFSRSLVLKWNQEQKAKKELENLNLELENKIAERTAELNLNFNQLQFELAERKVAEQALSDSQKKYRLIVQGAIEGILSLDKEGKLNFVNPQMASMLGYTIDEMLGRRYDSFIAEDELKENQEQMKIRREGKDAIYERLFCKKDGEKRRFLVSAKAIINTEGIHEGSFGMFSDITERKQAAEALKESENRYRLLFETAQEGILVIQDNRISFFNPMIIELTGYTENDLKEMIYLDIIYGEDKELIIENRRKRLLGEAVAPRYQFRIVKKDKSLRWVEISGVKIEWKGQPATMNFFSDITERKQAENEIQSKNLELAELNASKDKFFSIIAHDLKSPFTGFIGLTEILAEEASDYTPEELSELGNKMYRMANNLYELLKNLLEWAQIQKGAMSFNPETLSINGLIIANVQVLKTRSDQKGITLKNLVDRPIFAFADEKMMNSVLLNLFSNAIKFTHRGGNITIKAVEIAHQMIQISVSDSGIGMSKTVTEKLFKLGEKIGSKGTDGELSTGLGLLLCKDFIQIHGGQIWVDSMPDVGTTFNFTLPIFERK